MEETVTCMNDDPLLGLGLMPVRLSDQATFDSYFRTLATPLSDYTFGQLFTWSNSLRLGWKIIRGHLCVFANGTGDLTMLMPPIGEGGSDAALAEAFEVMDTYNTTHQAEGQSRVEYVSEELLRRFDGGRIKVNPMGTDYVYDVRRMIDLAGGDLASKRQLKNRFMRLYEHRVELYEPARHLEACETLLGVWKQQQDDHHGTRTISAIKRHKESLACELTLRHAMDLGLKGMVVYARPAGADGEMAVSGFTLGEPLGADQSSINIEKTDLSVRGLAQFIFSEFCGRCWADRPLVNASDDWGLETLAWTKMSYRPVKLLQKYEMRLAKPVMVSVSAASPSNGSEVLAVAQAPAAEVLPEAAVRVARKEDLSSALRLEQSCFSAYCLSKRQLAYLQRRPTALFLVAEDGGQIIGEGICLVRKHKKGVSGRIYSLAVQAEYRGRKIGQRLLRAMVEAMASRGAQRVYLEVEQANAGAVTLYERHGFKAIEVLPDYYGAGRPGLHMMCEVGGAG